MGTCRYGVSAGTGWPSADIQWLAGAAGLICIFCLSVVAHKIVYADLSQRFSLAFAEMLNKQGNRHTYKQKKPT